jgi:hypothetical protein
MQERKHPPILLVLSAALAVLTAACGGADAVGPTTRGALNDTLVTVLQVNTAKQASFNIEGTHKILFPAGSICDLQKSSYGVDEWQRPCTPATGVVTVTARSWYDSAGHPQMDFSPRMRFDPAADAVVLTLKDKHDVSGGFSILYCPDGGGACYDESVSDSTLVTYRDPHNGKLYRHIRHFSGYNIASGRSAIPRAAE